MIPVLMPLKDGHAIPCEVLNALNRQTMDVTLIPVSRPGFRNRRAGEALCRNILLSVLGGMGHADLAVMMDRDMVLLAPNAFERACTRLKGDESLKVVHIPCKPGLSNKHFDIGCMVFKREVASKVLFDVTQETCCCEALTNHLNECGWRQEYLSDGPMGRELPTGD